MVEHDLYAGDDVRAGETDPREGQSQHPFLLHRDGYTPGEALRIIAVGTAFCCSPFVGRCGKNS
jgi:hypothetical protein